MRRTPVVAMALAGLGLALPATAAPRPEPLSCAGFMRDLPLALPNFRVGFERPLTITRDLLGDDEPGVEIHVLSNNGNVDGTLRCRGDAFHRFEVRIGTPADARTEGNFSQFEQAAITSVLRVDKGRAATIVGALSSDADEYLRASIQRGDTYNAGKVEYHQGSSYDLGMIWTPGDKTLVIAAQSDE